MEQIPEHVLTRPRYPRKERQEDRREDRDGQEPHVEQPPERAALPPIISLAAFTEKYDREYQIFFKNGKVVQWGEPGDLNYRSTLSGSTSLPIFELEDK